MPIAYSLVGISNLPKKRLIVKSSGDVPRLTWGMRGFRIKEFLKHPSTTDEVLQRFHGSGWRI